MFRFCYLCYDEDYLALFSSFNNKMRSIDSNEQMPATLIIIIIIVKHCRLTRITNVYLIFCSSSVCMSLVLLGIKKNVVTRCNMLFLFMFSAFSTYIVISIDMM